MTSPVDSETIASFFYQFFCYWFLSNSALTEKIVAVLPKMKCPHLIEPHQIQGLDFINIFPVIQWLVKRSVIFVIPYQT